MNQLLKELAEERQDRQKKRGSSSAIIQPVVDLTAIVDDDNNSSVDDLNRSACQKDAEMAQHLHRELNGELNDAHSSTALDASSKALIDRLVAEDIKTASSLPSSSLPSSFSRSVSHHPFFETRSSSNMSTATALPLNLTNPDIYRVDDPRRSKRISPILYFPGVKNNNDTLLHNGLIKLIGCDAVKNKKGSTRKCGAAENAGTNGKNCDDQYVILADTQPGDQRKYVIQGNQMSDWKTMVVDPVLKASCDALALIGRTDASDVLSNMGTPYFRPDSIRTGEMRVIRYAAPRSAKATTNTKKPRFHRHRDHPHYGWVVLCSLGCTSTFYLKVSPNDERLLTFQSGDILVFEGSSMGDVVHGVDAIHPYQLSTSRRMAKELKCRISIQWRVSKPETMRTIECAFMAKNLMDYEPHLLLQAEEQLGISSGGGSSSGGSSSRSSSSSSSSDSRVDAKMHADRVQALIERCIQNHQYHQTLLDFIHNTYETYLQTYLNSITRGSTMPSKKSRSLPGGGGLRQELLHSSGGMMPRRMPAGMRGGMRGGMPKPPSPKYIAKRLIGAGSGRWRFEAAWHVDRDLQTAGNSGWVRCPSPGKKFDQIWRPKQGHGKCEYTRINCCLNTLGLNVPSHVWKGGEMCEICGTFR